jgi:DNA polymerase-3 subunit epsilon
MGWYFRKSLRAGPVRVNVSKSGIGVSAGVPGARVGVGPRGPYVAGGLS